MAKCVHCDEEAVTNLDGDDLCKTHADQWCIAEGLWQAQMDIENPLTYENYRG